MKRVPPITRTLIALPFVVAVAPVPPLPGDRTAASPLRHEGGDPFPGEAAGAAVFRHDRGLDPGLDQKLVAAPDRLRHEDARARHLLRARVDGQDIVDARRRAEV